MHEFALFDGRRLAQVAIRGLRDEALAVHEGHYLLPQLVVLPNNYKNPFYYLEYNNYEGLKRIKVEKSRTNGDNGEDDDENDDHDHGDEATSGHSYPRPLVIKDIKI
jgi:hypothetical protein